MAIKIDNTTVIDNSRNLTSIQDASTQSITFNGVNVETTAEELNFLDGVTTNVQNAINGTLRDEVTLSKSFATNEEVLFSLPSSLSATIPIVSVVKEVPQENITNNDWDVAADGANFTLHDTAYDTTLTPSDASADGTFTLGAGSFVAEDVGKRIVGNGGEAVLTETDGSYELQTAFNDTTAIPAGDWSMFGLDVESGNLGLILAKNLSQAPEKNAPNVNDIFNDGSIVATWTLEESAGSLSGLYNLTANTNNYSSVSRFGSYSYYVPDDGTTDHYLIREENDIDIAGSANDSSFTFSSWIRPTQNALTKAVSNIFVLSDTNDGDAFQIGLANGLLSFFNVSGNSYIQETELSADVWHHVAVTYDNTSSILRSYLDGIIQEETTENGIVNFNQCNIFIGQEPDSFDPYGSFDASQSLSGYIDQIRLFNRSLTATEVSEISGSVSHFTGNYTSAITTVSTNTEFWADINSMTADDSVNEGAVYYAVSTDDRTTWSIIDDTNGVRNIVRNNSGTWEVNDASDYSTETWVAASENDEFYALEEAVDINTALINEEFADANNWTFANITFDCSSEDTAPHAVFFKPDGLKMYILGKANDSIFEYNLSTAWDINTASYSSVSLDLSSNSPSPEGFFFRADGSQLYISDVSTAEITSYSLSTPWDISTAQYETNPLDVVASSGEGDPEGIYFRNDGQKLYVCGSNIDSVHEYDLSSTWDITSASLIHTLDIAAETRSPHDLFFKPDGLKMYVLDTIGDQIIEYNLSTAWDISTASPSGNLFGDSGLSGADGIFFRSNGTRMFAVNQISNRIIEYITEFNTSANRMDSEQLNAVSDGNHYTPENNLDLAITLFMPDGSTSSPTSDGVSINYDGNIQNQGAVANTDYEVYLESNNTLRFKALSNENFNIRVV